MQSPLEIAAALASPWPTWWVEAPDEAGLLEALAAEGPLPQADLFEPWEGELWRARVLHPPLHRAEALLAKGTLRAGEPPGLSEWEDRGRVTVDTLRADGVEAHLLADAEGGGVLLPELVDQGPDPAERALREAAGTPSARVRRAVHPLTGRRALRFEVPVPEQDPTRERQAALDAVARVLASGDAPALDPTLRWSFEAGTVRFVAWLVAAPAPRWPTPPSALPRLDLTGWRGRAELQLPLEPSAHAAVVGELSEALGALGLAGARPRWVGDRFAACWEGPAGPPPRLPDGVEDARWVPGCPDGLEPEWVGVDPRWWGGGARAFVQLRCGLRDRDLLPVLRPRDADAVDRRLLHALGSLGQVDPVDAGGAALRLRLPALGEAPFAAVVAALDALPARELGPVGLVRMSSTRFTLLLLRTDRPAPDTPPPWSTT